MIESPTGPPCPMSASPGRAERRSGEIRLLTPCARRGLAARSTPSAPGAPSSSAYLALHAPEPSRATGFARGSSDCRDRCGAKTLVQHGGSGRKALGRTPTAWRSCRHRRRAVPHRLPHQRGRRPCESCFPPPPTRRARDGKALGRAALELIEASALDGALGLACGARGRGPAGRALSDPGVRPGRGGGGGGNFVLARWALEQARLVDPYSEALTGGQYAGRSQGPRPAARSGTSARRTESSTRGLPERADEQLFASFPKGGRGGGLNHQLGGDRRCAPQHEPVAPAAL